MTRPEAWGIKVRLTVNMPTELLDSIHFAAKTAVAKKGCADEEAAVTVRGLRAEIFQAIQDKWLDSAGVLMLEFDLATMTARVVPVEEV